MMFLAHDSERYGYLQVNSLPIPSDSIARRCGCTLEEYEAYLLELDRNGIPSRTPEGIIYSRRMVRDAREREGAKRRKQKERANGDFSHGRVTPFVTPLSEGEDEEVNKKTELKEFQIDELVSKVLVGLSLPAGNPMLETAIGHAIEAKGTEPNWTKHKAALHMIERGTAYKSSAIWNSQWKKKWLDWFRDQCYDQNPSAWNGNGKEHVTESGQKIDRGYVPLKKKGEGEK